MEWRQLFCLKINVDTNVEYLKDNDMSSIEKSISELAKCIRKETEPTDGWKYKIKFHCESIIEGYSETLMSLLFDKTSRFIQLLGQKW